MYVQYVDFLSIVEAKVPADRSCFHTKERHRVTWSCDGIVLLNRLLSLIALSSDMRMMMLVWVTYSTVQGNSGDFLLTILLQVVQQHTLNDQLNPY